MADPRRWWRAAAVLLAVLVAPLLLAAVGVEVALASYRDLLLFALFAVALDLFWGQSGTLSFGQATFFGLGAYGMAVATVSFALGGWLGLVMGVALAAVAGLLLAYFLLGGGVRGEYFTVVTLTTALVAQQIAVGWSSVTGGDSGLVGVPPLQIAGIALNAPWAGYVFALVLLVAVVLGLRALLAGRRGRLLAAMRDAETKAQTLGYPTAAHLIGLFTLSAAVAGLAGAVYGSMTGFVSPDLIGLVLSTEVILWLAAGGRGAFLGAVVGAIVVWQVQQWVSSWNQTLWPLLMGLVFIALVFLLPRGVLGMFDRDGEREGGAPRDGAGR